MPLIGHIQATQLFLYHSELLWKWHVVLVVVVRIVAVLIGK